MVVNPCYICGKNIEPERFLCYDCAKKLLKNEIQFAFARGNGKSFIRDLIREDLEFYRIVDRFNEVGNPGFILTKDEISKLLKKGEE